MLQVTIKTNLLADFSCVAVNRTDPSLPTAPLAGFSTMKGKPVVFSVFGYDNCWPNNMEVGGRRRNRSFHHIRRLFLPGM